MILRGSCHCGAVKFSVKSLNFYPYQRCYCSICRKTQGGGGYAINLGADARTLKITGKKNISIYHARMPGGKRSGGERNFCKLCSSGLWLFDPDYPELVHPFASVIDSKLPKAPEHTHLMLKFRAPWVEINAQFRDKKFQKYPKESIAEWHHRLHLPRKRK